MFCKYCGKEIGADSVFCPHCGSNLSGNAAGGPANPPYQAPNPAPYAQPRRQPSTLATVAFVFMLISTIASGFLIIPLAWMLPMTLIFKDKLDRGAPIGTAFKVCILIFVSLIGGILLLVDNETP